MTENEIITFYRTNLKQLAKTQGYTGDTETILAALPRITPILKRWMDQCDCCFTLADMLALAQATAPKAR